MQRDGIAMTVGKDLDFDMTRARHIFLDQHALVAEGGARLAHGACKLFPELRRIVDAAHALAATAGDRLDQHRIADLFGLRGQKIRVLVVAVIAGDHRHFRLFHQGLGGVLQAHGADRRWRRADEYDAGLFAGLGKGGVFRQETVARMDGASARTPGGVEDRVHAQIAFGGRRRADAVCLVGFGDMEGVGVGIGIDRDGLQPHAARGADDADGDFAAIGDQEGFEHFFSLTSGRRRTASPVSVR